MGMTISIILSVLFSIAALVCSLLLNQNQGANSSKDFFKNINGFSLVGNNTRFQLGTGPPYYVGLDGSIRIKSLCIGSSSTPVCIDDSNITALKTLVGPSTLTTSTL